VENSSIEPGKIYFKNSSGVIIFNTPTLLNNRENDLQAGNNGISYGRCFKNTKNYLPWKEHLPGFN
jgi:hypothetical protein